MSDKILIKLYLNMENVNITNVTEWFEKMTFFKPTEMRGKKYTRYRAKKFNADTFYSRLEEEINNPDRCNMSVSNDENEVSMVGRTRCDHMGLFCCSLHEDVYKENEKEILTIVDEFVRENNVISGFSCFLGDWFWQHNEDIQMYEIRGKSSDKIKIKKSDIFDNKNIVDIEYNPGHSHIVNGIWFGSCWRMWYGKEFFKYISKESLLNFNDCYESKEIGDEFIRITLYENCWEYEKEENRQRQINFREQVGVDKVAHALENFKDSGENIDSSIEILEGEFEHGGVRIIKYYYDKNGNLTVKSQASEIRTFELDKEGNEVWSEIKK